MIIVYDVSSNSLKIAYENVWSNKLITLQELRENPTKRYEPNSSQGFNNNLFNLVNIDGYQYYIDDSLKFFNISREDLELMNNYGRGNSLNYWAFDLGFVVLLKNVKTFLVTVKHSSGNYYQYLFIGEKPFIKKVPKEIFNLEEFKEFIYEDNSLEVKLFISPNLSQPLPISTTSKNNVYLEKSLPFEIFNRFLTELEDTDNIGARYLHFLEYLDNNTESGSEIIDLEEYYYLIKITYNKIY